MSQSDTEVLLKAYGRWGEKCVGELRGMFAFALWDAKRSRLLLDRDPMDIKRSTIVPQADISSLLLSCARCSAQDSFRDGSILLALSTTRILDRFTMPSP